MHYVVLTGKDFRKMKIHDFRAQKASRRKPLWNGDELLAFLKDIRRVERTIKSGSAWNGFCDIAELVGRIVLMPRA